MTIIMVLAVLAGVAYLTACAWRRAHHRAAFLITLDRRHPELAQGHRGVRYAQLGVVASRAVDLPGAHGRDHTWLVPPP